MMMNKEIRVPIIGSKNDIQNAVLRAGLSEIKVSSLASILSTNEGSPPMIKINSSIDEDVCFVSMPSSLDIEKTINLMGVKKAPMDIIESIEEPDERAMTDEESFFLQLEKDACEEKMLSMMSRLYDAQYRTNLNEKDYGAVLHSSGRKLPHMIPHNSKEALFAIQGIDVQSHSFYDGIHKSSPLMYTPSDEPAGLLYVQKTDVKMSEPNELLLVSDAQGAYLKVDSVNLLWIIESMTPSIITLIDIDDEGLSLSLSAWVVTPTEIQGLDEKHGMDVSLKASIVSDIYNDFDKVTYTKPEDLPEYGISALGALITLDKQSAE